MNARIRRRGDRYEVFLDVGEQDAQRCPACVRTDSKGRTRGKLHWMDAGRLKACPDCGGELETVTARRERWIGAYERRSDALDAKNRATQDKGRGRLVDARRLTFGQFLDEWTAGFPQKVADGELKPSTVRTYSDHVRLHIKPALGYLRLQEVEVRHVNEFHRALAKKRGRKVGSTLSPTSRRQVHITLNAALSAAKRQQLIGYNPAEDAERPRRRAEKIDSEHVWKVEELRRFLAGTREDRLGVLWLFMGTTGLRRAEAMGLRWRDVDIEAGTLQVRETRVSVAYEVHEGGPKTQAGRRPMPLFPETVAALKAWKAQQAAERLQWGPAWTDTGHVFTRESGEPWHPATVSKRFTKAVEGADVPRIRLHDLRHGFATYHLAAGTQVKHLQKLMGHARIGVTMDVYVHPEYEDLAAAQDNLASVMGEGKA